MSTNVDDLIDLIDKKKFRDTFGDIRYYDYDDNYIFYIENSAFITNYVIFRQKIKVKIIKTLDQQTPLYMDIKSNLELYNFITQSGMNLDKIFICNKTNKKLFDINLIYLYIENNSLELKMIEGDIPNINFIYECLSYKEDYLPKVYSDYFFEYFPSGNIDENKEFKFIKSEKREEIRKNIIELTKSKSLKKYKITGPFSTGKSMTLFKISKSCPNIIYVNLKIVKKQKNYYKFLELLFSECSRIWMDKKNVVKFNESIKKINLNENYLNILIQVIKIFLDLVKNNIVLILDQYKKSNINDAFFEENIKQFNETKNLRIVYCSSINDNEIRDALIPSFNKMNKEDFIWNEKTQEFYFYFIELYKQEESKDILFILFNNKLEYINLVKDLGNKECFKKVDAKIEKKLKKFKKYQEDINIPVNNYNLADILIFLKTIINQELEIKNISYYISVCPLKFFVIDVKKDTFIIKPLFPYITYFISEYIQKQDCREYFIKEKYKDLSFLSNKVKGEYFEYSAKLGLKKKLMLNYKIDKEVYVDQIADMNEITTPFDYFLSSLKSKVEETNEVISENKIEKEPINSVSIGVNEITVNLDKNIDRKSIAELVKQNYINNLNKFDIYQKIEKEMNVNDPKLNKNVKKFGMKTDYIDKILFKDIYHYRIDFFEKKVNKRTEEIINDINTRKNANKNKRIVKIPINKKCRKTSENKLKCKFQGNENLFIDQTNTNGRVVDYAFLFGERENKKLVLFQMKCYSNYTSLADLFVNKNEIKEKLSPMLLNSIKLFNCLISEWFYILVFYYNIKDSFTSYIGIKTISSCINKDIEYLLYDPIQDLFYLNSKEIKESENLELMTIDSNLDQFSFCNTINIMSLTHFNNDKLTNPLIKKNHDEGLLKFVEEMNKINIDYKALQRILKVDFLIYYCHYILENDTITPEKNLIILYKKKNSNYFVSVKNNSNIITYYDLEGNIELKKINNLIDYDHKFCYVLYFEGKFKRSHITLETGDTDSLYIRKQRISIKLNNE